MDTQPSTMTRTLPPPASATNRPVRSAPPRSGRPEAATQTAEEPSPVSAPFTRGRSASDGYSVRLQSLPKPDSYPSLTPREYIVRSGVIDSKNDAEQALKACKGNFSSAEVVKVSSSSSGSAQVSSDAPQEKEKSSLTMTSTAPDPTLGPEARSERRDELARQAAQRQWDLGGLASEVAIGDHFRLDVLVRMAAELQTIELPTAVVAA